MRRKIIAAVVVIAATGAITPAWAETDTRCTGVVQEYAPSDGMVPSQSVALDIARTYLWTIYGADQMKREMPLKATLRSGVWRVVGTWKGPGFGGNAEIEICRSNGRVLSVIHGE